jgi:galactokinase
MTGPTALSAASAEGVRALFRARYGREPDAVASAPGRVNLIGEHTDYNGGEVLPIAIASRTWVAAAARPADGEPTLRAASSAEPAVGEARLAAERSGQWWDYLVGVAGPLMQGLPERGIDLAVASDVPAGAGLSSSAALEVSTALAVSTLLGRPLDRREAALAAWRAETAFVGVECGIMDQFASALASEGQALHIECETAATSLVPFEDAVLIVDSGVRRSLRDSAFNQRRAECAEALRMLRVRWPALASLAEAEPAQIEAAALPDPLSRRALHVSRETRRVREAVALLRRSAPLTRELLLGSHESLRDLYECSRPELDWLVEHAVEMDGVRGARLTGAGWGGCVIVVGDEAALEIAAPRLARSYRDRFGLASRLWLSRASSGARVEGAAAGAPGSSR